MKKIYFSCAVAGGRDYAFIYQDIVNVIKQHSVEVLGELFADPDLEAETGTDPHMTSRYIWKRDSDWVRQADGIIAEVSQPSLGVGYEIMLAESLNKPVLALFYKKSDRRFSPMIAGNPHIETLEYTQAADFGPAIKKFITTLG